MYSSNGTSLITEIEAKLGDLMRDGFPHDGTYSEYHKAKDKFLACIEANGIRLMSFWDYTETKKKKTTGINLAPSPFSTPGREDHYVVFDDELATRVLALGFLPR
jgi:hypothetical protein